MHELPHSYGVLLLELTLCCTLADERVFLDKDTRREKVGSLEHLLIGGYHPHLPQAKLVHPLIKFT